MASEQKDQPLAVRSPARGKLHAAGFCEPSCATAFRLGDVNLRVPLHGFMVSARREPSWEKVAPLFVPGVLMARRRFPSTMFMIYTSGNPEM